MKRSLSILTLVASAATVGCASLQVRNKTSAELIALLEAPDTSRRARKAASDQLKRRPPADVLPGVFTVHRHFAHHRTLWGSGHHLAAGEAVTWQEAAAITASDAWSGSLEDPTHDKQQKGAVLLGILSQWQSEICKPPDLPPRPAAIIGTDYDLAGLSDLMYGLQTNWVDGTEHAITAVLTNDRFSSGCRLSAAHTLVSVTGTKHFGEILDAAANSPLGDQHWYARLLLGTKPAPEWEARVLRFAVTTIKAERAAHPDYAYAGYFVARAMEHHTGRTLTPEVVAGQCCPEELFRGTVDNALAWWEANEDRFPTASRWPRPAALTREEW